MHLGFRGMDISISVLGEWIHCQGKQICQKLFMTPFLKGVCSKRKNGSMSFLL